MYGIIIKTNEICGGEKCEIRIVGSGVIVQDFLTITSYLKKIEITAICYKKEVNLEATLTNVCMSFEVLMNNESSTLIN